MSIDFGTVEREPGCDVCHQPLREAYWEANGKAACLACHDRIEASRVGGSPAARFLTASAYGTAAMLAGAAAWWAVAKYAGLEAALVAIFIGWLVGRAVRAGSQARGGLPYQIMAMAQTYLAIVLAYVALSLPEVSEAARERAGILLLPTLVVLSFLAPFGGGLGTLLSVIIIGVGLMQAWRQNRPTVIRWTGPHPIRPAGAPPVIDVTPTREPPGSDGG